MIGKCLQQSMFMREYFMDFPCPKPHQLVAIIVHHIEENIIRMYCVWVLLTVSDKYWFESHMKSIESHFILLRLLHVQYIFIVSFCFSMREILCAERSKCIVTIFYSHTSMVAGDHGRELTKPCINILCVLSIGNRIVRCLLWEVSERPYCSPNTYHTCNLQLSEPVSAKNFSPLSDQTKRDVCRGNQTKQCSQSFEFSATDRLNTIPFHSLHCNAHQRNCRKYCRTRRKREKFDVTKAREKKIRCFGLPFRFASAFFACTNYSYASFSVFLLCIQIVHIPKTKTKNSSRKSLWSRNGVCWVLRITCRCMYSISFWMPWLWSYGFRDFALSLTTAHIMRCAIWISICSDLNRRFKDLPSKQPINLHFEWTIYENEFERLLPFVEKKKWIIKSFTCNPIWMP